MHGGRARDRFDAPGHGTDRKNLGERAVQVPQNCLDRSLIILVAPCEALAKGCASSAMIYAMHQSQVVCIVDHGVAVP